MVLNSNSISLTSREPVAATWEATWSEGSKSLDSEGTRAGEEDRGQLEDDAVYEDQSQKLQELEQEKKRKEQEAQEEERRKQREAQAWAEEKLRLGRRPRLGQRQKLRLGRRPRPGQRLRLKNELKLRSSRQRGNVKRPSKYTSTEGLCP